MKERKAREREILEQKRFLEHTQRELERVAGTDALTGIANRRRFEEVYAQEWSRAQRNGSSLSLALVDIDAFKGYNDPYGHQRGDLVLICGKGHETVQEIGLAHHPLAHPRRQLAHQDRNYSRLILGKPDIKIPFVLGHITAAAARYWMVILNRRDFHCIDGIL